MDIVRYGCITVGELATFYTKNEERSITGGVTRIELCGRMIGDYINAYVLSDGMEYCFGTGGHLGDTWTSESGLERWFVKIK